MWIEQDPGLQALVVCWRQQLSDLSFNAALSRRNRRTNTMVLPGVCVADGQKTALDV